MIYVFSINIAIYVQSAFPRQANQDINSFSKSLIIKNERFLAKQKGEEGREEKLD